MGIHAGSAPRRAAAAAVTLATVTACTASTAAASTVAASTAAASPAASTAATPRPAAAIMRQVSRAHQDATQRFWTRSRMAAATALPQPEPMRAGPAGPPPGIPSPVKFGGVPTVGALFFTTGTKAHFCTASVVNSRTANLILTAAHCVYGSAPATHIEFVPAYHHGKQPYGVWPVRSITVAAGWRKTHNQNLDFAFLAVSPPAGTTRPIQRVTGGLWLGINSGYAHPVEVIGYNDTQNTPIRCATHSFKYEPSQMKFYCHAFWDGTSGGPWIVNYHPHTGAGAVIGVIGGYEQGGDHAWASYSAYFGRPTLRLYLQAQRRQG
jgi:V8-like Glu-specific endopeptidase